MLKLSDDGLTSSREILIKCPVKLLALLVSPLRDKENMNSVQMAHECKWHKSDMKKISFAPKTNQICHMSAIASDFGDTKA